MGGLSGAPQNKPSGERSGSGNTNVINGKPVPKPKNILQAISDIQQLAVMESYGQNDIDGNFLSIMQKQEYFSVGTRSAGMEILLLFVLLPLFGWMLPSFLVFFYHVHIGIQIKIYLLIAAVIPILIYLPLCIFLANLYKGNITRAAINSLLIGRSMLMVFLGIAVFISYYILYLSTDQTSVSRSIINFLQSLSNSIHTLPKERVYYFLFFYTQVRPDFYDIAWSSLIIFLLSGLIPVFIIHLKHFMRILKAKRANKRLLKGGN